MINIALATIQIHRAIAMSVNLTIRIVLATMQIHCAIVTSVNITIKAVLAMMSMHRAIAILPSFDDKDCPCDDVDPECTCDQEEWNEPDCPCDESDPDPVSYSKEIQPIWDNYCIDCHHILDSDIKLVSSRSYNQLIDKDFVDLENPDTSIIYQVLKTGEMPPDDDDPAPTEEELQLILKWIQQGALNN